MSKKKKMQCRSGFTLVEIMAVIVIIGLLAAFAAQNFIGRIDEGRKIATKVNLKILHQSVLNFKMDTGRYPTEEEGLSALIEQPTDVENWSPNGYLESDKLPRDGWKREFIYQLNPESGKPFVLISYGADGNEGGEGYDTDLYSTDAE